MLTQEQLKYYLHYDEKTGIFTWLNPNVKSKVKKGDAAGSITKGYRIIGINRKWYLAHRLAWLYVYGYFPCHYIDHINHNKDDNSLSNLREATNRQNQQNAKLSIKNKSGYKGVCFHKLHKKYIAKAKNNKKNVYLGYYDNPKDAYRAYLNYTKKLHGFFFNDAIKNIGECK